MSAGPLGSSKGVCQRAVQEALLSHLCALADAGLSSAALACDCLAHRFGNVADRGVRERRYPPDGHVGCRVGGARARRSHYKRRGPRCGCSNGQASHPAGCLGQHGEAVAGGEVAGVGAKPQCHSFRLLGWSLAVSSLGGASDGDCRVGRSAVLVALAMVGAFDRKVAHFPFDNPGVAAISPLHVDFARHFTQKEEVAFFTVREGEKIPASISGTE